MPTYDYVCDACKHEFELFQSIKEEPKKQCPKCGKKKLRRLIGPGAAIVFKGSGFYTTDYRSESYKKGGGRGQTGSGFDLRREDRGQTRREVRREIQRHWDEEDKRRLPSSHEFLAKYSPA